MMSLIIPAFNESVNIENAVKKSVELVGGSVWVESIVDEGSTFYVKLPFD